MSEKEGTLQSLKSLAKDSINLVEKCRKPDKKEYIRIVQYCAIGFAVMGVIGFLIKLLFIPINNILLGSNA